GIGAFAGLTCIRPDAAISSRRQSGARDRLWPRHRPGQRRGDAAARRQGGGFEPQGRRLRSDARDIRESDGEAAVVPCNISQSAMPVIGFPHLTALETRFDSLTSFHRALGEVGYIDGENIWME